MRFVLFAAVTAAMLCVDGSSSHSQTVKSYRHLILDGYSLKWGEPVLGTGATVTYALVKATARFGRTRNCSSITSLKGLFSRSAISRTSFLRELGTALAAWEAVADISFSQADPAVVDILIGAQAEPVGFAFANVEYDRTRIGSYQASEAFPAIWSASIRQGDGRSVSTAILTSTICVTC